MNKSAWALVIRTQACAGCSGLKLALCGECPAGYGMLPAGHLRLRDVTVRSGPNMRTCETVLRLAGCKGKRDRRETSSRNTNSTKKRMKYE